MEIYGNKEIRLHDAIRVIGSQHLSGMPSEVASRARIALKDLMVEAFERDRNTARFSLYTRLLLATGDVKTLVDLIGEEMFHEMGVAIEVWHGLEALIAKDGSDPEQRYWALDGLVFSDMKLGHLDRLAPRLAAMEQLINSGVLGEDEVLSFLMKRMLHHSNQGDEEGVRRAIRELDSRLPDKPVHRRIFLYNAAAALFRLQRYESAMGMVEQAVSYPHLFDCSGTPGEALAISLVRELAAKLAGADPDAVRKILLPGATGVESLRQLDIYLNHEGLSSIVVLDNVHRVSAESIKRMVDVTSALRFVLLAQPLGTLSEIEALLG